MEYLGYLKTSHAPATVQGTWEGDAREICNCKSSNNEDFMFHKIIRK